MIVRSPIVGRVSMNHRLLKVLSILLVLCVLSIGGLAQAKSVEHAGHHAHHQAATHGTVLCSWMCAAGTVLDTPVILVQWERSPIAVLPLPLSTSHSVESCRTSPSRAPPSFSL
jgi:predicted acyltransferase